MFLPNQEFLCFVTLNCLKSDSDLMAEYVTQRVNLTVVKHHCLCPGTENKKMFTPRLLEIVQSAQYVYAVHDININIDISRRYLGLYIFKCY